MPKVPKIVESLRSIFFIEVLETDNQQFRDEKSKRIKTNFVMVIKSIEYLNFSHFSQFEFQFIN